MSRAAPAASAASAVLRHAAQHGVDQSGITRRAPVGLRQPHRQIDRGVVGHLEPEDLRRADEQDGLHARRVGGKSLVEKPTSSLRNVPSRRSTVAARRRISARSRSASEQGRDERPCRTSCSSSATFRRNTPSRMSAAMRRAARPGTSGWGDVRARAMRRTLPRIVSASRSRGQKTSPRTALRREFGLWQAIYQPMIVFARIGAGKLCSGLCSHKPKALSSPRGGALHFSRSLLRHRSCGPSVVFAPGRDLAPAAQALPQPSIVRRCVAAIRPRSCA